MRKLIYKRNKALGDVKNSGVDKLSIPFTKINYKQNKVGIMNTKEILLTKGFSKSISNPELDAETVENILSAKSATKFMEAVNAISDEYILKELLFKEAQTIYKEFGFAEYRSFIPCLKERYDEFIVFLKFNV